MGKGTRGSPRWAMGGRVGFTSTGLIEYAPDFQLHDGAMYIYFRPRRIDATSFQTVMIDSAFLSLGARMFNADEAGRRIVTGQLQRGFTVVRYNDNGETDFGMGHVPKGQRPFKPFQIRHSDKVQLANDRTEIHSRQMDFIGGFEVTDDDQALYLTLSLDGAPAADVFVVPEGNRRPDDRSLRQAERSGAAPGPPAAGRAAARGPALHRYLALPKGLYYLVIDHSPDVGRTAPPVQQGDDRAAKIDYLVQLGERP